MASESVLHIRFDYKEAFQAKRDLLNLEMSTLKVARALARYKAMRLDEFKVKARVYARMKEVKKEIRKLENLLPKTKIPKILKKEEAHKEAKATPKKRAMQGDIESQLAEIQDRLAQLQAQP